MRLIGLDPGLRLTGWGVIEVEGNRLRHVAHGVVKVATTGTLAERLRELFEGVAGVVEAHRPVEAAVEETFVNVNPGSTLKLGQARGVVMLAPARAGLPVFEYSTNLVKKSVVGTGHADKNQIAMMVGRLLPGVDAKADAADALAVAICHAPITAPRRGASRPRCDRQAQGSRRLGRHRQRGHRCRRRRLSRLGSARTLARSLRGGGRDHAGRDDRARGCDRALRFP
jgi:crossover junction endodeoxyribonuclease RuvC